VPPTESTGFRRVLFHGRPVVELSDCLLREGIAARPFRPETFRLAQDETGVLLVDPTIAGLLAEPPASALGTGADRVGLLLLDDAFRPPADRFWTARTFFSLPDGAMREHLERAIVSLFRILEDRSSSARARRSLSEHAGRIRGLLEVGIALTAERDPERLLDLILTRARALTWADAGSLYLIEPSEAGDVLRFALAQNDSVRFSFRETLLPLDDSSIAGFVARHGEALNLPDVSGIPEGAPYRFEGDFDRRHGYRTRSMLTVPMQTPQGRTLGVLQLLNRTVRTAPRVGTTAVIRSEVVPFDADSVELARSLAAQAAVAVENRRLTERIRTLFENFVQASVTAIEQRDPTTAGHSQRVAALTVALAELADRADAGPYAAFRMSKEELRELRYAAVLHDFGKVAVREEVLVKANKLPPRARALVRARVDQALLSAAAQVWERAARDHWSDRRVAEELARRSTELERAWEVVERADVPSVLPEAVSAEVARLAEVSYRDPAGRERALLETEEIALLSIPKGSLSSRERLEIQSHVAETFRFLARIPWTPDLARVPEWAFAHHEKLDGSGYPRGLSAARIPVPVRMLTIADIYDALAARDRPYKKAVGRTEALDILRAQAARGLLDRDLLELFTAGKVYERVPSTS